MRETHSLSRVGSYIFLDISIILPRKINRKVNMSLISLIVTLGIVGVLLWLVNTYIPMDGKIKKILNIVVVIVVVIWLLNVFGILGSIGSIHVAR